MAQRRSNKLLGGTESRKRIMEEFKDKKKFTREMRRGRKEEITHMY